MDDLNGLDWSAKPANGQRSNYQPSAFSTLRPTPPDSGRISPLPRSLSPNTAIKTPNSAADSFSNLVTFNSNSSNKNLSLNQQQKKLADLKSHGTSGHNNTQKDQFAGGDDNFWNNLGSGRSTPQVQGTTTKAEDDEDDDFLAAFNKPQPVVVKSTRPSRPIDDLPSVNSLMVEDDDDPFGLSEFQSKHAAAPKSQQKSVPKDDDNDVLGLLGKPVGDRPPAANAKSSDSEQPGADPQDRALAELVDMGFSVEKARRALQSTETGTDVQGAVSWLLNQAHLESRDKSRSRNDDSTGSRAQSASRTRDQSASRDSRSSTPFSESSKTGSDFGATLMKSAGSFWKQAKKQAQQAMNEFNTEAESNQPKWLRTPQTETRPSRTLEGGTEPGTSKYGDRNQSPNVTDEALMLEIARPEKPQNTSRPGQRQRHDMDFGSDADNSRDHSPAVPSKLRTEHGTQSQPVKPRPPPPAQARAPLSRQAAEQQASQAYVSSARRRKPANESVQTAEADLLGMASRPIEVPKSTPRVATTRPAVVSQTATRPPPPKRDIPSVSAISLKASHSDRNAGNDHFKRGDYASAHQSYTKSLSYLPKGHPITIILLTNRALTSLKTGEPKQAVTDSDAVIVLIGVSKGEMETIDLNNGDAPKPMKEYFGKALMRKAEALEHMEKWSEAAAVWREAVESGHGGSTAIQGRMRAEKAASPSTSRPKPAPARRPAATAQRKPASNVGAAAEAAAVSRLRAQNAAAEKIDDEKFALSDAVEAKLNAWKGGKQDNLRALLGSLDTVLWPETGWKKISMADLVLPNKVRIQYMKGIAKVHPDKIPGSATTEQRMIAGAVFSTLNEAWDKFKKENGL